MGCGPRHGTSAASPSSSSSALAHPYLNWSNVRVIARPRLSGFRSTGLADWADDTYALLRAVAEGVGLLRTEFLFMNRETMPDEDTQFESYRTIIEAMNGDETDVDCGGASCGDCALKLPLGRDQTPRTWKQASAGTPRAWAGSPGCAGA